MEFTKNKQFKGIIPPLVTPMETEEKLNTEKLSAIIEHIIAGGVNGIFVLGTTGEAASLGISVKKEIIRRSCRFINQRVLVLAGITTTCLPETLELAREAEQNGADAVVVCSPYYFPITQNELYEYIKKLHSQISLPIFLYNMPSCTKTVFEVETLRKLAELPGITGVKDSSADMDYFRRVTELKQIRPDWSVMIGPELLLDEAVSLGADGGITGGANLFPGLFARLYQSLVLKDEATSEYCKSLIGQMAENIYEPSYISGLKYALYEKDLCPDFVASPLQPADASHRQRIKKFISENNEELSSISCDYSALHQNK
ncbi:putative 2-keto-3-deoxy-galactonate aldolase YagE [Sedimentisphaera cyanobacteriorum]|uniref:Putative 2-keto-3-deoxy-galactonate aldolase YagE n=1 Tax=Sedimentisphaera cyanobacteriorum TaxID=1940790 RepID=A0A1Q2HR24_9BACT|nr:dihydrodipicolinate synthase family protein [Sedimentisphaera cyanobacteriorum]AQQ09683.1 putative 2-keto-3-deoxy-galactonate aldolase YagE [Sedimentisphaera cyanobacteriorum]